MVEMNQWSFRELAGELAAARRWADRALSAGGHSSTAGTRLEALEQDVEVMARASETEAGVRFSRVAESKTGLYSLLEARDFTRIHQTFGDSVTPGLVQRLDLAVRGPRAGIDETGSNSAARNFLAELSWATLLRVSGFAVNMESDPTLESDPDVVLLLAIPGATYAMTWEVKRPTSAARVADRLRSGAKQVRRTFEQGSVNGALCVGGVVVLVMDYVLGVRPVVLAESASDAENLQRDQLKAWWVSNERLIRSAAAKAGVAGVLMWWRPLALIRNASGIVTPYECTELLFDPLGSGEFVEAAQAIVRRLRWP